MIAIVTLHFLAAAVAPVLVRLAAAVVAIDHGLVAFHPVGRLFDPIEHQIPVPKDKRGESPFSTDANLLHTSSEGKVLEDPWGASFSVMELTGD